MLKPNRRMMPGMLVALMASALAGTEAPVETYEQRRARALSRQRSEAILLGVPSAEVDGLVAELDAKARDLAAGEESDWFWAFDIVCRGWRDAKIADGVKVDAERFNSLSGRLKPTMAESMLGIGKDLSELVKPVCEALMAAPAQELLVPRCARTAADVNRERRARGELGTKRQRKARKSLAISRRSGPS